MMAMTMMMHSMRKMLIRCVRVIHTMIITLVILVVVVLVLVTILVTATALSATIMDSTASATATATHANGDAIHRNTTIRSIEEKKSSSSISNTISTEANTTANNWRRKKKKTRDSGGSSNSSNPNTGTNCDPLESHSEEETTCILNARPNYTANSNIHDKNDDADSDEDEDSAAASLVYESSDVAWCRRRPTWRSKTYNNRYDTSDEHPHPQDDVRMKCSNLFQYYPNPKVLIKGNHPFLSVLWNDTYTFDDNLIEEEIEYMQSQQQQQQQQQQSNDSNKNKIDNNNDNDDDEASLLSSSSILERPVMQQLIRCMDTQIQQDTIIAAALLDNDDTAPNKTTEHRERMLRPTISKVYSREEEDDDQDENDDENDGTTTSSSSSLPIMVVVENALNEMEVRAVEILADCLRTTGQLHEFTFEHRGFETGGNEVTFLAGFLQLLLPGVAYQIHHLAHRVWSATHWGEDPEPFRPINSHVLVQQQQQEAYSNSKHPARNNNDNNNNNNINNDQDYDKEEEEDNRRKVYSTKWWPNPYEMGIRTTEYLTYDKWGGLGYHEDRGKTKAQSLFLGQIVPLLKNR